MKAPDHSATFPPATSSDPDQAFSVDRRYRYMSFNPPHASAMKKAFGVRIALRKSYLEYLPEGAERSRAKAGIDAALKGRTVSVESSLAAGRGSPESFHWSYHPLRSRSGAVRGVSIFVVDITKQVKAVSALRAERKRMKEAVRESTEMFRFVFDNAYDGISLYEENPDPEKRRLIECNDRYAELNGRSKKELLRVGRTFQLGKVLKERTLRSVRHGEVFTGTFSWNRPDGRDNIIEYTAVSVKVGNKTLTIGIDRDVTQQRRAEEHLEQSLHETRVRYEVSQALAGKETEDEVLDAMRDHALNLPHAHPSVVTLDPASEEPVGILRRTETFQEGRVFPLPPGMRFPRSRFSSVGRYGGDEPFVVHDVADDDRLDAATREILLARGDRSYAVFPLKTDKTWLGWIAVAAGEPDYFNAARLHVCSTLAEQGAVALQAARFREAIRESQQRLTLLIEQSPLAVIEWNTAFEARSWNSAAERIFGYQRNEALARHAVGLVLPEELRGVVEADWKTLLVQQGSMHRVYDSITRNGQPITCEWFNAPLISAEGRVIGVVSLIEDITARRKSEADLQLTSFALQRVADAVYWMDPAGRIVDVNEAACRSLGYSREEFLRLSLADIDPHWTAEAWRETWNRLKTRGTLTKETQHRTRDGGIIDVEVVANFIGFGGRELDCALARDITQRKQVEEAIRASE